MKVLKGILAVIVALMVLLGGMILLCAVNPDLSENLGKKIRGEKTATEETLPDGETDARQEDTNGTVTGDTQQEATENTQQPSEEPAENSQDVKEANSGVQPPEQTVLEEQKPARGAEGYEIPDESSIQIPQAVSGKGGYTPISETSVELTGADGGEYTSSLGYGETGDGLTFDSVMYPYYYMLDEKGKHLYRQIYANALAVNKEFVPIEAVPVTQIKDVVEAVYNDHPELFWLNTAFTCKYDKNKICAELTLEFNQLAENLADNSRTLGNEANRILTQVQNLGSDQEKEKALHDILIQEVEYDTSADMNQSVYSALVNKKSVCAGYARGLQYLMQRLGIPCYYCTGYAGQDHAWNIVKLGDIYYNVDVTWDDTPGGEYDYYNKSDKEFASTHIRKSLSVDLPGCDG